MRFALLQDNESHSAPLMKSNHLHALCAALSLLPSAGLAITNGTETFSVPDDELLSGVIAEPGNPVTVSDVQGWDFTIYSDNAPTNTRFDIWDGVVASGNGVAFSESSFGSEHHFTALRITPSGDFRFDLDSIGLNLQLWDGSAVVNNQNVTLYGLDATGSLITGATLTLAVNDGFLITFDTSEIPQFDQISGLLIAPSSGEYVMAYGFVDNLAVSNVSAIPEPATWATLTGALSLGLVGLRRRRK